MTSDLQLRRVPTSGYNFNCLANATYGSLGRFDPSVSTAEDRVASDAARREIHMRLMQRLESADLNESPSWHQGFSLIDAERIFKVMCPLPSPPLVWEVRCVHCLGFPSVQVLCPLRPLLASLCVPLLVCECKCLY